MWLGVYSRYYTGEDLPKQHEGSRGLSLKINPGSCVARKHPSLENPRRTCVTLINTQARVGKSARSKFEWNNLNLHKPERALNARCTTKRPLCGVGDHVGRFCVHGNTPYGQTWPARKLVSILWWLVLCAQVTNVVGNLQFEPDLVAQNIETLTSF